MSQGSGSSPLSQLKETFFSSSSSHSNCGQYPQTEFGPGVLFSDDICDVFYPSVSKAPRKDLA